MTQNTLQPIIVMIIYCRVEDTIIEAWWKLLQKLTKQRGQGVCTKFIYFEKMHVQVNAVKQLFELELCYQMQRLREGTLVLPVLLKY